MTAGEVWCPTLNKAPHNIGVFSDYELAKEAVERYAKSYEWQVVWHGTYDFDIIYEDGFQANAGRIISIEIDMYYHGAD